MKRLSTFLFFLFISVHLLAAKVDTVTVFSNSMQKEIKCVVITPKNYKKSKERFPVVYLLHGYSGNYAGWIKEAKQLTQRADELQLMIVCADGGFYSWYYDSPVDPKMKYETFVSKELVSYIDTRYKTIADKKGRAITGLSMGGHGALYLAVRNKEVYSQAGSMAGGVDIRPFPNNWQIKQVLGDITTHKENWDTYTVINQIETLKNGELHLIIDCGLGDFFLEVNRSLHQKLMTLKIDHDYTERPGAHNGAYWGSAVDYHLLFFKKGFEKNKIAVLKKL